MGGACCSQGQGAAGLAAGAIRGCHHPHRPLQLQGACVRSGEDFQPASTVCLPHTAPQLERQQPTSNCSPLTPTCRTARWPTGAIGPTSSVWTSRPCPNCSSAPTRITRWAAVVSLFRRTWDAAWRRDARVLPSSRLPSCSHDKRKQPADLGLCC